MKIELFQKLERLRAKYPFVSYAINPGAGIIKIKNRGGVIFSKTNRGWSPGPKELNKLQRGIQTILD